MGRLHDRASESLAPRSEVQTPLAQSSAKLAPPSATDEKVANDVLSDVLRTGKLTGALFFMVDAAPPWQVAVAHAKAFAPIILPRAQHVISYHIVTQGSCWFALLDGRAVALNAGDVVVFPHGDPYAISTEPGEHFSVDVEGSLTFFRLMAAGELPFTVVDGGAGEDRLHLVCGFLGCDARPFNPLLATLPRMLHVCHPSHPETDLLSRLIELTLAEARAERAGGECIRLRLSELMFIEVVRRYLATLSAAQTGWLAGLRDPAIGRALALLHERPAHAWTLDELANNAGLSRSALAERFAYFVGQPPMHYLTQWRMQVAARALADGTAKVASVACEVGYASEAAFSRTFKKITGVSPSEWRHRSVMR
jgi:AraC-like DNA-binding protein